MLAEPRRSPKTQASTPPPPPPESAIRKRGGRPKGPPSTILNLRIPLDLLERLDGYPFNAGQLEDGHHYPKYPKGPSLAALTSGG
jgi:hypothetical protein